MRNKTAALAAACVLCLGLNACGNAAETYTEYVQAVMDCTYMGNEEDYRKLTGATDSEAKAVYQNELEYLSNQLCYQASVEREKLDAETASGFDALAAELLGKVKYSVSNAISGSNRYQITITAEPVDLFTVSLPELESTYHAEFAEQFYKIAPDSEQGTALEAEWGSKALSIYHSHLEETGYLEQQSAVIQILPDAQGHYTVSEQDWKKIDAVLFGLSKTE